MMNTSVRKQICALIRTDRTEVDVNETKQRCFISYIFV